jgi:hypothetical protein
MLSLTSQALALCQLALAKEGGTVDSVVLFDRRDYVAIQGFTTRVGQTFLVQVLRKGLVAGAASGVIKAGGLTEINHPGGTLARQFQSSLKCNCIIRSMCNSAGFFSNTCDIILSHNNRQLLGR